MHKMFAYIYMLKSTELLRDEKHTRQKENYHLEVCLVANF